MIDLSVADIAEIVGGKSFGDSGAIVTAEPFFDSRSAIPGGIFLALEGQQVDGHNFVEEALAKGGVTAFTTRQVGSNCIVVCGRP